MPIVKEKPNKVTGFPQAKPTERAGIITPVQAKFTFDDLILDQTVKSEIDDLLSFRKLQYQVFEQWGLSKTHKEQKKVAINFYGPSGTGKTMAAHGVASHFSKNIMQVNYADIESKYVGDTPKNLVKIFEQAKATDSVLFFDEADAMLSKRVTDMTSATDTSVNQSRSVLLMLLNDFEGIIVFATNFISNFDSAFMRRILGHVHFPLPEYEARKKIWQHLLPKKLPNSLNIDRIAKEYDGVSGSDISNAILKSAMRAARKNMACVPDEFFTHAIEQITKSNRKNHQITVTKKSVSESFVQQQLEKG